MAEIGQQVVIVMLALAISFAGPLAGAFFLVRRRRAATAARRSPLTRELLRGPGQALRERLEELRSDVAYEFATMMAIPNMAIAFVFIDWTIRDRKPGLWLLVFLALASAGVMAYLIRGLLRKSVEMDKLRKGLDAEVAVGQELDQLMRQGAAVFHDFQDEKFNIDHIVIAQQGIFCVETKGYTKAQSTNDSTASATVSFDGSVLRFPNWQTSKPIEQAARQSEWLANWLKAATGSQFAIIPVLALPGWFVDRRGRHRVHVYSGKELPGLLRSGSAGAISAQDMQRAVHQIEQRCRNVKPTFRPAD